MYVDENDIRSPIEDIDEFINNEFIPLIPKLLIRLQDGAMTLWELWKFIADIIKAEFNPNVLQILFLLLLI